MLAEEVYQWQSKKNWTIYGESNVARFSLYTHTNRNKGERQECVRNRQEYKHLVF